MARRLLGHIRYFTGIALAQRAVLGLWKARYGGWSQSARSRPISPPVRPQLSAKST